MTPPDDKDLIGQPRSGIADRQAGGSGSASAVTGGPVKGEDTACIVKHVKAEIADTSQSSLVLHTYGYFSAHESPDGSLVHSGPKSGEGYQYIAPDGTAHQRNWTYNKDGSPTGITGHGVTGPVVNGKQDVALTIIDPANHTYSQTHTEYSVPGGANAPGLTTLGLRAARPRCSRRSRAAR